MGADAAIVMFDLTSRVSFREVTHYIKEVRAAHGANLPIVVCGNKADCKQESRCVSPKEIRALLDKHQVPYFDVSAKFLHNQEEPYLHILRAVRGELMTEEKAPMSNSATNHTREPSTYEQQQQQMQRAMSYHHQADGDVCPRRDLRVCSDCCSGKRRGRRDARIRGCVDREGQIQRRRR